jgi:uncharacterized membrane protein YdjX (TVP38/TMEM64 family)
MIRKENQKKRKFPVKLILLGIIILAGVTLHQTGVFDWYRFLEIGQLYAHTWWLPPLVVIIKAVLYMFALPGSSMYWISGILFEPLYATIIVVIGGVLGAVLAYRFSQSMSNDAAEKIQSSRFFKVIRNHSDFATLSAVRSLPNFPHSIINYGAGILRIPMKIFLPSTLIGFTAKGYLYTSAIHHASTADDLSDVIKLQTVLPLILLTLLFVIGKFLQRKLPQQQTGAEEEKT